MCTFQHKYRLRRDPSLLQNLIQVQFPLESYLLSQLTFSFLGHQLSLLYYLMCLSKVAYPQPVWCIQLSKLFVYNILKNIVFYFNFYLYFSCVLCVCIVQAHVHHSSIVEVKELLLGVRFLLSSCAFQGSNPGHQAWHEAPSSTQIPGQPTLKHLRCKPAPFVKYTRIALKIAYKSLKVLDPMAPLYTFVLAYFCGFTWVSIGGKQFSLRNQC